MKNYLLLCYFLAQALCNLVWGGDFEFYPGPFTIVFECNFTNITSNISTWYDLKMGQIELKSLKGIKTTYTADLSSNAPMTLCQNVQLIAGKKYRLDYQLFNIEYFQTMVLTVYLDSVNISSLVLNGPNTFGHQTQYFYSNKTGSCQLCFNETHQPIPIYVGQVALTYYGGLIDNISLIEEQQIEISFQTTMQQINSSLILTTNFTYNKQTLAEAKDILQEYFGKRFVVYRFLTRQDGFLQIYIQSNFSFILKQLQFSSNVNLSSKTMKALNCKIDYPEKYFYYLNQNCKISLSFLEKSLEYVTNIALDIRMFFKISSYSYYILTLISFESLSLYYIFLNIPTVPEFTKKMYSKLLQGQYHSLSLSNFLQKAFNVTTQLFQPKFEIQNVIQKLDSERDGQKWFGYYELSSLFIKNNLENFFFLFLLIVRIKVLQFILKIIARITSWNLSKYLRKKLLLFAFCIQFITMIPTFIISALSRIQNCNLNWIDIAEKICQISLLYFCLFVLVGHYFINYKKIKVKKSYKKINSQKKQQVQNKQQKKPASIIFNIPIVQPTIILKKKKIYFKLTKLVNKYQEFGQKIIYFTIPFFLYIFNSPKIFFIINSIALTLKIVIYHYYSNKSKTLPQKLQKIAQILINIIWVIHHSIFITFYVVEQNNPDLSLISENTKRLLEILGYAAIITVLIGCCLEMVKCIIILIQTILFGIEHIKNYCCQKQRKDILQPPKLDKIKQAMDTQQNFKRTRTLVQNYLIYVEHIKKQCSIKINTVQQSQKTGQQKQLEVKVT